MARQEGRPRGRLDRAIGKILVSVTSYMGENPIHRKHKVFFATLVSGELVDPKGDANHKRPKGKLVNIPALGV
jgi:hypothetical protein